MKRFFLFAALVLIVAPAKAQTLPADSAVTFSVKLNVAAYVAARVQQPDVLSAIAEAANGVSDTGAVVSITVTQQQVVDIFQAITRTPEGIGADPNKMLLYAVFPKLAGRPWLAAQVGAIRATNDAAYYGFVDAGLSRLEDIQRALNRNRK